MRHDFHSRGERYFNTFSSQSLGMQYHDSAAKLQLRNSETIYLEQLHSKASTFEISEKHHNISSLLLSINVLLDCLYIAMWKVLTDLLDVGKRTPIVVLEVLFVLLQQKLPVNTHTLVYVTRITLVVSFLPHLLGR